MAQRDEILEQKTTSEDSEQAKQQENDIEKLQERLAKMRTEYQQMELTEQNNAKILGQHEQKNDFRIRLEKESIKRQEELMNHLEMVNKRIMEVQTAKARKYAAYKNKTQQLKYIAQQEDREIKKLRQTASCCKSDAIGSPQCTKRTFAPQSTHISSASSSRRSKVASTLGTCCE